MKKIARINLLLVSLMVLLPESYLYAQCLSEGVDCGILFLDGAFRTSGATWDSPGSHSDINVNYYYNHDDAPADISSGGAMNVLSSAIYVWNDYNHSRLFFGLASNSPDNTKNCGGSDNISVICWMSDSSYGNAIVIGNYEYGPVLGSVLGDYNYEKITNADIRLYNGAGYSLGASPGSGNIDFKHTIVHELGHAAGLEHTPSSSNGPTMEEGVFANQDPIHGTITNRDRAGFFFNHPRERIGSLPNYDVAMSARPTSHPVYLTESDDHSHVLDLVRETRLILGGGVSETVLTLKNGVEMRIRNGAIVEGGRIVVNDGASLKVLNDGYLVDVDIVVNNGGVFEFDGVSANGLDLDVESGGLFEMNSGTI